MDCFCTCCSCSNFKCNSVSMWEQTQEQEQWEEKDLKKGKPMPISSDREYISNPFSAAEWKASHTLNLNLVYTYKYIYIYTYINIYILDRRQPTKEHANRSRLDKHHWSLFCMSIAHRLPWPFVIIVIIFCIVSLNRIGPLRGLTTALPSDFCIIQVNIQGSSIKHSNREMDINLHTYIAMASRISIQN